MSATAGRIVYGRAVAEDSGQILRILEEGDFHGKVGLLYTRRPDAYASLKAEGREVDVYAGRDTATGDLIGFGACAYNALWVDGEARDCGYLFALRLARKYRTLLPAFVNGYRLMAETAARRATRLYLTTILSENEAAIRLLEKRRSYMPRYHYAESFVVHALKLTRRRRGGRIVRRAEEADRESLEAFFAEQGPRRQFFPVVDAAFLRGGNPFGLSLSDFYLMRNLAGGDILVAGCLWNQRERKQYIVTGYRGILELAARFRPLVRLTRYPDILVPPGTRLDFSTLSFWIVKDGDPELFSDFLDGLTGPASSGAFVSIGLTASDPLRAALAGRKSIDYESRIYLVDFSADPRFEESLQSLRSRPWHLETGLL